MHSVLLAKLREALLPPGAPAAKRAVPSGWTRRGFLLSAASAAVPLAYPALRPKATAPRIAIVGGGIAGLNTAWRLKQAGLASTIYEASTRSGGRMFSATGVAAPGVVTELGGEFIDSNHKEILGIARRFGLKLIDTAAPSEKHLHPEAFLIEGQQRSPAELAAAFREISPALKRDVRAAGRPGWERFDRLSIAAYLDSIGLSSGYLRSALDVAFRTEFGLDIEDQSAMNMLSMLKPKTSGNRIRFFGDSDERYKILGGNQLVADAVAGEVRDQIQLGMRLESVAARAVGGYRLSFQKAGAGSVEVDADAVVLAIPFTILRSVNLDAGLPDSKRRAIAELGYGTNAKMFFGFERRLWRERGYAGAVFTDTDCQLVWDSSRLQPAAHGALTMLTGGKAGVAMAEGDPASHESRLLPHVEKVWNGISALRTGAARRFHWPTHQHTLGAYACYRPGQWTTIRGTESTPAGQLYFAGEHCSTEFQGFMEGGASTGREVARILRSR